MALRIAHTLSSRALQIGPQLLSAQNPNVHLVRTSKHWNPKWRSLRGRKVLKVDLPNYREKPTEDMSEEEIRSKLKEHGLLPNRPWIEKQYYISSTGAPFEPYVPPEGDGKISPIQLQGAKQQIEFLQKKSKTMLAIRKIRTFEENFDTPTFCNMAEQIYIKMHQCMAEKNLEELPKYVTERAYPEVIHNLERKTIRWRFIKNVELPRIAHARCTDVITKENVFGQVTVRFHTQQSLAVYDRFGRLMHGSEIIAKDVLEYIVFEKHLANEYGIWRIHAKIIPDWLPPKESSIPTRIETVKEEEPEETLAIAESQPPAGEITQATKV